MSDCCELTIDTTVDEISIDDPGVPGIGIPPGGLINQILVKKSNGDYDTEWKDSSANPSFAIITGSPYDNINLAAALNVIQGDIPTLISQLTNDVGFITASALTPYLTIATAASTYATQSSVTTALALKANLASPTFTGTVTLPAGQIVNGVTLQTGGSTTLFLNQNGVYSAAGTGSVTAVSIVSANGFAGSSSGGATPALTISTSITGILKGNGTAISAATAGTDYLAPFGSQTANFFYAAPNGSAGVPTFRAIVGADIPTLNQSTTGSAATLTTARNIAITGDMAWNVNFNGSANVTAAGTLATVNTTTGAFGSATQVATFTVNGKGLVTISGATTIQIAESQVTNLVSDLALKAPLASPTFTGTVTLPAGQVVNGVTLLTTGGTSVFLRGDGTYAAASGGGGGTVTSIDVSGGTTGLTTSGGPVTGSGTITLAGTLSIANGGTGQITQQLAINALAGAVTSGLFLRGNGTNVVLAAIQAADVPTLNQNTTGSAATWTTARNLAGNSVNGSADVAFANKFIVQGTADAGLTGAQFMGSLATGITKNTTVTGVQTIAVAGTDYEVPLTFSTGLTRSTNTITVNTSQNITNLTNLSTAGSVQTTGVGGALSIVANTGMGNNVLATTPTLVTPILGVATATSINKVTITAPTTSATLTLITGSSLITAGAFALTLTSTAASNATIPAGTNTLYSTLSGSITSAQLATSLTDETGSGSAVFATSPTVTGISSNTYTSTVATGTAPFTVTSTTAVANLSIGGNAATATLATASNGLISATTTVSVSAATAPTSGQVLTATSGTAATWQTPSGGAPAFSAITSATNTTASMVVGTGASLSVSGSGTITATAAPASGLTGATLASGVTASSLTSVGTLTSLAVTGTVTNGGEIITSTSATAFVVGPNGTANPTLLIDASAVSAATGIAIKSAAASGGVTLTATSSGSNESITILGKGFSSASLDAVFTNLRASGSQILGAGSAGITMTSTSFSAGTPILTTTLGTFSGLTASTEATAINYNLGGTITWATGTLANQRDFRIISPTHNFSAASTITLLSGLSIGAPIAGANANVTTLAALNIEATAVGSTVIKAYGLIANAPTGATNNFAAQFNGPVDMAGNTIINAVVPGGATTANFTATSNTTLAIITGTSNNVTAAGVYTFCATLRTTATTAGGIKVQMGGTATATNYNATVFAFTSTTNTSAVTASTSYGTPDFSSGTATAETLIITGTITVNAAGTFGIQFAQNTSNAAVSTALAGATLILQRIS